MQIDGLWSGKLAGQEIVACFDDGRGAYYYRKHLKPIFLRETVDEDRLKEGYGEDVPQWTFEKVEAEDLHASWSDGERTYPIWLERRDWTAEQVDDWNMACTSPEYFAPMGFEAEFDQGTYLNRDFPYRRLKWQPPEHFAGHDVTGFYFEPAEPGDMAILEALAEQLDPAGEGSRFMSCLRQITASQSSEGIYDELTEPDFANTNFLSARRSRSSYCGGAHPAYDMTFVLFDRQSGAAIDARADWLSPKGFTKGDYGQLAITDSLRSVVLSKYPEDFDEECRYLLGEADSWEVGMVGTGLTFFPSLPYGAGPCMERRSVPWEELQLFLSPAGKLAAARTQG